jgi:hydrogenase-4 component F
VFLIAGDAIGRYGTRDIRMIRGLLAVAPLAGTILLMGTFSLTGTPPFSIFISELMVIQAGLAAGRYVAVAVFLVMVVIIFAGLIHHVGQMVFGVAPANASRGREAPVSLLGILLLVAAMLLLGVYMPVGLDRVLSRATEIILG